MRRFGDTEIRLFDSRDGPVPTESEDRAILALIEDGNFDGSLSLLYTRRPSPWRSLCRGGARVRLVTGWRGSGGELLGMGAAVTNPVWQEGRTRELVYLTAFRLNRSHRGAIRFLPEAYGRLLQACGWDSLFLTSILEENEPARRLLEKRRTGLPAYHYLTGITTLAVAPRGRGRVPEGLRWRWAGDGDAPMLHSFLRENGARSAFFPVVALDDLRSGGGGRVPPIDSFVVVETQQGDVRGCGALWDQGDHKQYIVMGYRGAMALLRPVSGLLFPVFGYPALPRVGETLTFRTAALLATKSDDPDVFGALISALSEAAKGNRFFLIGYTDQHPHLPLLSRLRGVRYRSRLYRVFPPGADSPEGELSYPYVELASL
jgi:hypothetical protein